MSKPANLRLCSDCLAVVMGVVENDWCHKAYGCCDGTPPKNIRDHPTYKKIINKTAMDSLTLKEKTKLIAEWTLTVRDIQGETIEYPY